MGLWDHPELAKCPLSAAGEFRTSLAARAGRKGGGRMQSDGTARVKVSTLALLRLLVDGQSHLWKGRKEGGPSFLAGPTITLHYTHLAAVRVRTRHDYFSGLPRAAAEETLFSHDK